MNTEQINTYVAQQRSLTEQKRRTYVNVRSQAVNTYNALMIELVTYFADNEVRYKKDGYPHKKYAVELAAITSKYETLTDDRRIVCRITYSRKYGTRSAYQHLRVIVSDRSTDHRSSYEQQGYVPDTVEKFTPVQAVTYEQVVQAAARKKEVEKMQSELKGELHDLNRILNA